MTLLISFVILAIIFGVGSGVISGLGFIPNWKIVDGAALALGGFSLIAVAGAAGRVVPANKLVYEKSKFETMFRTLKMLAIGFDRQINEGDKQRLVREMNWVEANAKKFREWLQLDAETLTDFEPERPPDTEDEYMKILFGDWLSSLGYFNNAKQSYVTAKQKAEPIGLEEFGTIAAPYLLSAGIAFSLLKIVYGP